MGSKLWKWILGLVYIVAVASIWIAASFVVQSLLDGGVYPFLITYICNSLFVVYIPLVELSRRLEDYSGILCFWNRNRGVSSPVYESEQRVLLGEVLDSNGSSSTLSVITDDIGATDAAKLSKPVSTSHEIEGILDRNAGDGVDEKGRWTRARTAKVSLLICPFWFLAQLTFNLSLKYTTVTSNTILSTSSSLFTFLVSLAFLGEKFTWVKFSSVLLCMAGTIIVSLGDSGAVLKETASNPLLGDILAIVSAGLYAVYITLIRIKLPEEDDDKKGRVSMAQFLGYLGLFNLFIFLPVALVLNLTKLEPFDILSGKELGIVVGKGLFDNVLSDYLWARAVVLTTTTVATAGLTIQVPLAAVVDSLRGNPPSLMDCVGAVAVLFGFVGINLPSGNSY